MLHRYPPRGSRQKGTLISHLLPGPIAKQLQKDFLRHIFSILHISQHGIRNPEHEPGLALNEAPKAFFA